jgi:hypothetical protein
VVQIFKFKLLFYCLFLKRNQIKYRSRSYHSMYSKNKMEILKFFQSDLSCSGGEQTNAGDSGIYSLASPQNRIPSRQPSPVRRTTVNNRNNVSRFPIPSPSRAGIDKSWNRNLADHAVVLYDHKKSTPTEMSLVKSQVVQVLDSKPGTDWWRVRDDTGRDGYYPANFLKLI